MTIRTEYQPPKPGLVLAVDGLTVRFSRGRKADGDRMLWLVRRDFDLAISHPTLGFLVCLLGRNEDVCYPGGQGADYLLGFLAAAVEDGLMPACKAYQLRAPTIRRVR
jgi:hypothetical protein